MEKIYIPSNINYNACYTVQDKDTIRVYQNIPRTNSTSNYVDVYINSHYLSKNGSQTWGNTSTLPSCLNSSLITDDYFYSVDFSDSLIIFLIIFLFTFYFAFRIFKRIFGRWFNV